MNSSHFHPSVTLVSSYEALRDQYLGKCLSCADDLGLSVLIRLGMFAWSRELSITSTHSYCARSAQNTAHLSAAVRNDFVDILVNMVARVSCAPITRFGS